MNYFDSSLQVFCFLSLVNAAVPFLAMRGLDDNHDNMLEHGAHLGLTKADFFNIRCWF